MEKFQKIIATLALTVMLLCINYYEAESVPCPSCSSKCVPQPPVPDVPLIVNFAECQLLVFYDYCWDFMSGQLIVKIRTIRPVGNCPLPLGLILHLAATELLASAHWIGGVPGASEITVVLEVPACMEQNQSGDYVDCGNNLCCSDTYKVRLINGCPTITERLPFDCECLNPVGGCQNTCDKVRFPSDTCLKQREQNPCQWWCYWENSFNFGDVSDVQCWGYYGWDADTLCVELRQVRTNGNKQGVEALRRVTERILDSLYRLTWDCDGSLHYIRITLPSCFSEYYNGSNSYGLAACDLNCCTTLYPLHCVGGIVLPYPGIPKVHYPDPDPTCPEPPNYCSIPACTSFVWDTDPMPRKPDFEGEGTRTLENQIKSFVKPNPSEGIVDFYLISPEKGTYQIVIYDNNGNKVQGFELVKNQLEAIHRIDISNFVSGLYFYRVFKNSEAITSGKFIISK